tara:strand:- start:553 stop:1305 length:753 start_codon:yes stop_codon:yes gene_type:complete
MKIFYILLLTYLFISGCSKIGIMVSTDKELNRTKFFHYPFITNALKTDRYEISVNMMIECEGTKICLNEESTIKIVHKGSFAFLKKKQIFIEIEDEVYDLNKNINLTYKVDLFEKAKDGSSGIIIEEAFVQIETSIINKIANSAMAYIVVGDYRFLIPKYGLENWRLLTDLKLSENYFRENQKTKYLTPTKNRKDQRDVKEIELKGAEGETWELVKKSDKISDYEYFIKNYPESKYVVPAKLRISQLKED